MERSKLADQIVLQAKDNVVPPVSLPISDQVDPIGLSSRSQRMEISRTKIPQPARVPVIALLLGWAGVIPFAALAAVVVSGAPPYAGAALAALGAYGAIILSFMGGVLWGLEMSQGRWQPAYAVSVAPALVAAASMVLHPTHGILLLVCGFAGLLSYDMKQSRSRGAPVWYPLLRWQLTAAVTSLLSVALLFTWLA